MPVKRCRHFFVLLRRCYVKKYVTKDSINLHPDFTFLKHTSNIGKDGVIRMRKPEKDLRSQTFIIKYWYLIALVLIAALSFWLNFYAISNLGYGNAYYAAAVKSMTQSFKNFFFVSFDPAGMVSVDKPPLGLWIQVLSVTVFGYQGWAMLLPQALAGTGSAVMMYVLTGKYFGRPAGLISALVFAVTPAVVVASRNNTMDMQLVFVLLVSVWFLFKAIEKSKWRYLFYCALFVGLGFNIKMLQAFMILPTIAVVYLVFSKEKFSRRLIASGIGLLMMVGVSFAWVAAVDLTPASQRPYVDSSANNTVSELIVGHNGLERLYGQGMGGRGGAGGGRRDGQNAGMNDGPPEIPQNSMDAGAGQPFPGSQGGRGGPGGIDGGQDGRQGGGIAGNEIGTAGVFRLWTDSLYGQASWLIVLALFCIAARARRLDLKKTTLRQGVFIFWIVWLISMYGFFSFAGFWHRYYLCMLAPAVAGLIGPGIVQMARALWEKKGWRRFFLPAALAVTFVTEAVKVWNYAELRAWLLPLMAGTAAAAFLLMALHFRKPKRPVLIAGAVCMLASLLAAPLYWCWTVVAYAPQNITMPYAGPELASTDSVPGMTPNQEALTESGSGTLALENYLVEHYREGSFLVVSQRANDVAQFIVDTGLPAMAYGGFLGSDNAMTLEQLKEYVQEGKITYFLVTGQGGFSSSDILSYVRENAILIDPSEYGESDAQTGSSLYLFE